MADKDDPILVIPLEKAWTPEARAAAAEARKRAPNKAEERASRRQRLDRDVKVEPNTTLSEALSSEDLKAVVDEATDEFFDKMKRGEDVYYNGGDRGVIIAKGDKFEGTDHMDEPVDPDTYYAHDWNDTGELTRLGTKDQINDLTKEAISREFANLAADYWTGDEDTSLNLRKLVEDLQKDNS